MNPRDTILTPPIATRPIGPDVGVAPSNPFLMGLKTAEMFYDRPVALRNLDRQIPNLSTAPKIRTMENPFTTPDMTLRQVPPNLMASTPRMEVTQNDASNYTIPKRNQYMDESIATRRMLQDQQLIYGDRVPPQVLMDPKRQSGLMGDVGEAYLRVPKRNTMDISFGESRNTQNARFYGAYNTNAMPSDINDVSRRRMPDRGQFISQSTPREFSDLDSRSQTIFTRNMSNPTDAGLFLRGFSGGKVPGNSSRFEVPVDSRRRI